MNAKPYFFQTSPSLALRSIGMYLKNWRRRVKEQPKKLLPIAQITLLQNMIEGVIVLDQADRIVEINPAALKIMNLAEAEEALGKPISRVLEFWKDIFNNQQTTQDFNSDASLPKGGQISYYDIHATLLKDENQNPMGRLVTLHDITERVLLMQELQKIAQLDPLLGLYNRRHFYELASREFERARRYNHPLSILMLDLDHFKQVNDYHGHLIGDQALMGFSQILLQTLRSADVVARFGGDEFVILLPETDTNHANQMAERLRTNLKETPIASDAGILHLTFSGGISSLGNFEESLEKLIERADQALYISKTVGRDRVTVMGENN